MNPDTTKTIEALKTQSIDLRSQATDLLAKADVIDLAVSQLEGTLVTQIKELTPDEIEQLVPSETLASPQTEQVMQVVTP